MTTGNWQLRCAELKQRGAYLFKSKLWSDCAFQLDDVTIKAHKLIMAMASPVFSKIFYGEHVNNPVPIYDVRLEVFNTLLEYMYSDNLNINSSKDACDLYYAAKKWRLPHITKECAKYLSEHMSPDNVCRIYQVACESDDAPLQKACEQIFSTKTTEVLNDDSFYEANLNTVIKLFSLDPLNIHNELDLYTAAVKYADKQDKKTESTKALKRRESKDVLQECLTPKNGPSPAKRPRIDNLNGLQEDERNKNNVSIDMEIGIGKENSPPWNHNTPGQVSQNSHETTSESTDSQQESNDIVIRDDKQKEKYRDLIKQIRFLTLSPQEFGDCQTLSSLLKESDMLALSLNIASKEAFMQMPEGFSATLVPRTQASKMERLRLAAVYRSTINNFKNTKKHESMPFYLRNFAWTFLTIENPDDNILIVAVTCFHEGEIHEWLYNTKVKVKFCTHKTVPKHLQKVSLKWTADANYGIWMTKFNRNELINPENGFIDDFNAVIYKVYVNTVPKPSDSPMSSALKDIESNETSQATSTSEIPRTRPMSVSPVVTLAKTTLPCETTKITPNALKSGKSAVSSSRPSPSVTTPVAGLRPSTLPVTTAICPSHMTTATATSHPSSSVIAALSSSRPSPIITAIGSSRPSPSVTTTLAASLPILPVTCNTSPKNTPQIRSSHVTSATATSYPSPSVTGALTSSRPSPVVTAIGSPRPSYCGTTPLGASLAMLPVPCNTSQIRSSQVTSGTSMSHSSPSVTAALSSSRPAPILTTVGSSRPSLSVTTPLAASFPMLPVTCNTLPLPTTRNTSQIRSLKMTSATATSYPSSSVSAALLSSRPSPTATVTAIGFSRPSPSVTTPLVASLSTSPVTCNTAPSNASQICAPSLAVTKPPTLTNMSPSVTLSISSSLSSDSTKLIQTCQSSGVTTPLFTSHFSNVISRVSKIPQPIPPLSVAVTTVASSNQSSDMSTFVQSPTTTSQSSTRPANATQQKSHTLPDLLTPQPVSHLQMIPTDSTSSNTFAVTNSVLTTESPSMPLLPVTMLPSRSPPVTTSVLSFQPIHAMTIPWPTSLTSTAATTHSRDPCLPMVPTLPSSTVDTINKTTSSAMTTHEPFITVVPPSLPVTTAVYSSYPLHAITIPWPSRSSHTVTDIKTSPYKTMNVQNFKDDTNILNPKPLMNVSSLKELAFAMLGPLLVTDDYDFLYDTSDDKDVSDRSDEDDKGQFKTDATTLKWCAKQPPSLKEIAFSMLRPMIVKEDYDYLFE